MDFGTVNFEDLFDFSPEPLDSREAEVQRQNEMMYNGAGSEGYAGGEEGYGRSDGGYVMGGVPENMGQYMVQGRQVGDVTSVLDVVNCSGCHHEDRTGGDRGMGRPE